MKKTICFTIALLFSAPTLIGSETPSNQGTVLTALSEGYNDFSNEIEEGFGIRAYDSDTHGKDLARKAMKDLLLSPFKLPYWAAKKVTGLALSLGSLRTASDGVSR